MNAPAHCVEIFRDILYDKESGDFFSTAKIHRIARHHPEKIITKNFYGYIVANRNNKVYRLHRIAYEFFYGKLSTSDQVDHINGVRDDNRLCNLKKVTNQENQYKANPRTRKKYNLLPGVGSQGKRFYCNITNNFKVIRIGTFDTEKEAFAAYIAEKRRLHGDSAAEHVLLFTANGGHGANIRYPVR